MVKYLYATCCAAILFCPLVIATAATPTAETLKAFDRYIQVTEMGLKQDLGSHQFLYMDRHPELKAKTRTGEILVEGRTAADNGTPIIPPNGMIQDWLGMIFIPNATIPRLKAFLQDYDGYKNVYKPEVLDSKLLRRQGDEFDIFMRLFRRQILTVVLNVNYQVKYLTPNPDQLYITSRSTRVAEVKNPGDSYTEELPVETDNGFLWRMNSYWRVESADGGLYAELEAVSLSRDVPAGLGWLIKGFLTKMPRDSMMMTLKKTREALEQ